MKSIPIINIWDIEKATAMRLNAVLISTILIFVLPAMSVFGAQTVTTSWGGDAEMVYETGFVENRMKHSGGGESLFNMELIENDAPGERMIFGSRITACLIPR